MTNEHISSLQNIAVRYALLSSYMNCRFHRPYHFGSVSPCMISRDEAFQIVVAGQPDTNNWILSFMIEGVISLIDVSMDELQSRNSTKERSKLINLTSTC